MLILGIETSGKTASAAVFEDGIMLCQTTLFTSKTHSQVILPMAKKVMEDCGKSFDELNLIAVSAGPGSYTGIRIGIAAVKAMAFGLGIPCCAVSTLEGLAFTSGARGYICPVMKARQDLVYTAVFFCENGVVSRVQEDKIISASQLNDCLVDTGETVTICGDGAEQFIEQFGENKNYCISPPHVRLQSAAGICLAAMNSEPQSPDEIQASYLQLVKAEKDLIGKSS
ncbi:MAG: tRNA (adenosine(37)-N6)-threonylcarbamoyltransferase complex dimerization subunit type 1 TsaB [Porcipelethomonas sp.]